MRHIAGGASRCARFASVAYAPTQAFGTYFCNAFELQNHVLLPAEADVDKVSASVFPCKPAEVVDEDMVALIMQPPAALGVPPVVTDATYLPLIWEGAAIPLLPLLGHSPS